MYVLIILLYLLCVSVAQVVTPFAMDGRLDG